MVVASWWGTDVPPRTTTQGLGRPPVTVITTNGSVMRRRPPGIPAATKRMSNRIVQVVIVATSAFALLDLALLASSLHH